MRTVDLTQIAVERAKWQMTSLSSDLEKKAVGEAQRRSRPEDFERGGHDLAVLKDQRL